MDTYCLTFARQSVVYFPLSVTGIVRVVIASSPKHLM